MFPAWSILARAAVAYLYNDRGYHMHVDAVLDDEYILGISSRHVFLEHNESGTTPTVRRLMRVAVGKNNRQVDCNHLSDPVSQLTKRL